MPLGPVPPVAEIAGIDRVAIREQHGETRLVRRHPHLVAAEDVGPIREESDAAKAFRLALGAEVAARGIEPHQLRVALRRDLDFGFDHMLRARERDHQHIILDPPVVDRSAVDRH